MSAISIPTSGESAAAGAGQTAAKATAPAMIMLDPSSAAFAIPKPPIPTLVCRYNPKTLTIDGGTNWEAEESSSGRGVPNVQFKSTKARTLKVDLVIDQFFLPSGNVNMELKALQDWCTPRESILGQSSAPYLRFQWGSSRYFKCVLESYSITHTLFAKTGAPLRAEVSISLKEIMDALPGTNPTSGGEGGERAHVIRAGDTLHSVAHAEYGRPSLWRGLAAFNGIDDPWRLATGAVVALPDAATLEDLS